MTDQRHSPTAAAPGRDDGAGGAPGPDAAPGAAPVAIGGPPARGPVALGGGLARYELLEYLVGADSAEDAEDVAWEHVSDRPNEIVSSEPAEFGFWVVRVRVFEAIP